MEKEEIACSVCGRTKKLSEFHKSKSYSTGFFPYCKLCKNLRTKEKKEQEREKRRKDLKQMFGDTKIGLSKYANSTKKAFFFPDTDEKICAKCSEKKKTINFWKHNQTQDGFHSWCKDCCKLGQKRSTKKKYSSIEGRLATFLVSCKNSAKRRGQECTITRNDLIEIWKEQEGKCNYSGLEMTTEPSKMTTVSVERINSNIGYTRSNTVLVCNYVNRMKSDLTLDEFFKFCFKVHKYNQD